MKKIKLYCLLLFAVTFVESSYAQAVVIDYNLKEDISYQKGKLILDNAVSTWSRIVDNDPDKEKDFFLTKKKNINTIYYSTKLFGKWFFVKDTLHNMKWKLTSKTDTVLSYKCNSATTQFRGRTYTALYSTQLGFSDGPWKFGGLPGVILSIKSEDGTYDFSAFSITKGFSVEKSVLDLNKFNFITWEEYTKEFPMLVDKMIKQMQSTMPAGETGRVKIDFPEVIYPKLQMGEGIEY